jgi:hypothetical protein
MRRISEIKYSEDEEMIQQLLDIIFGDIKNPRYDKYKTMLMDKYGVDWKDHVKHDNTKPSLDDIKSKHDFNSWDSYKAYAGKIYHLRGGIKTLPRETEGTVTFKQVQEVGDVLGYVAIEKPYSGFGNFASVRLPWGDEMRLPKEGVSIGVFVHELGHVFDGKHYDDDGISKVLTNSSTAYGLSNGGECLADNFKHYFLNPRFLKNILPHVYKDLDKAIPNKWKKTIKRYIKISEKQPYEG